MDCFQHRHPSISVRTYHRGKRQIDFILVSSSLLPALKTATIEEFGSTPFPHSDHTWEIISSHISPTAIAPEQQTRTQRPKSTTGNKSTLSPKMRSSLTIASNHLLNEDPNQQHKYPSSKRPIQIPWNKNTKKAEIITDLFIEPQLSTYPTAHPTPKIASKAQLKHTQMPLKTNSPANPGKKSSVVTIRSSPQPNPTTRETPTLEELNSQHVITRASCNINPTATTTWYNPSDYEANKINENMDRHAPKQIATPGQGDGG